MLKNIFIYFIFLIKWKHKGNIEVILETLILLTVRDILSDKEVNAVNLLPYLSHF